MWNYISTQLKNISKDMDNRNRLILETLWHYVWIFFGAVIVWGGFLIFTSCSTRRVVTIPAEKVVEKYDTLRIVSDHVIRDSVYVYRDREIYVRDSIAPILDSTKKVTGMNHYYYERVRESDGEYRNRQERVIDSLRNILSQTRSEKVTKVVEVKEKTWEWWWVVVVVVGIVVYIIYKSLSR